MPVLAYIYARSVLTQAFLLKKTDFLLFLPAILYTLSFVPFYLWSAEQKLVLLKAHMLDRNLMAREPEGMLPEGWGISLRMIFGVVMSLAQFRLLWKHRKNVLITNDNGFQNREVYRPINYQHS